jgi:sodium/potassium-transporting ATPase subunit alpha
MSELFPFPLQNKMTVTSVTALDVDLKHTGILVDEEAQKVKHIASIAGLCNAAAFERGTEPTPNGPPLIRGDATDIAILRFADAIKPVDEHHSDWKEVFRIDFNSKMKFSKCSRPRVY